MDRSVSFYRDVLGLPANHVSPYWSSFQLGSLELGLHSTAQDHDMPVGVYGKGWHLGLAVADLDAFCNRLTGHGVHLKGDRHEVPGGVVQDFVDPDGNTLEAYQAR